MIVNPNSLTFPTSIQFFSFSIKEYQFFLASHLIYLYFSSSLVVSNTRVVTNPVQVGGNTGEASWGTRLATSTAAKGGDSDQFAAVVENQWATGVTTTGRLAIGSVDTENAVGQAAVGTGALRGRHDLQIDAL